MLERTHLVLKLVAELYEQCTRKALTCVPGGLLLRGLVEARNFEFPTTDLYVADRDLKVLANQVEESCGAQRVVERFDGGFRYIDLATTYIDLRGNASPRVSGLHVCVLPFSRTGLVAEDLGELSWEFYYGYHVQMPQNAEVLYSAVFGEGDERSFPVFPEALTVVSSTLPFQMVCDELGDTAVLDEAISESQSRIAGLNVVIGEENAEIERDLAQMRSLYGL